MRLIVAACIFLFTTMAWSHDLKKHETDLQPGDVGFAHEEHHEPYKRLWIEVNGLAGGPGDEKYQSDRFGPTYRKLYESGKCACKSGYCRPTKYRTTQLGALSGYDVLVSRQWIPVPQATLHHENSLSPELWGELMAAADAHVCAYPDPTAPYGQRLECVIVPEHLG